MYILYVTYLEVVAEQEGILVEGRAVPHSPGGSNLEGEGNHIHPVIHPCVWDVCVCTSVHDLSHSRYSVYYLHVYSTAGNFLNERSAENVTTIVTEILLSILGCFLSRTILHVTLASACPYCDY